MMHNWRNSSNCLVCGLAYSIGVYPGDCPGKREPPDKITTTKFEYEPTRLHDPAADVFDQPFEVTRQKIRDFFK